MKRMVLPIVMCCTSLAHAAEQGAPREGMPSQPVSPVTVHGHTNALVLRNRQLEVVVFPDAGRIGMLRFAGMDNVLRFDQALAERTAGQPAEDGNWRNLGGDWMWPVSQARWAGSFGRQWPPPLSLDGLPWRGHAWRSDDGAFHALLRLDVGAPAFLSVQRRIRLDPEAAEITIRQRIERTAVSQVPVTAWNISQIADARRVAFPVEPGAGAPEGFSILDFAPPPTGAVTRATGDVVVVDVRAGTEHKLGSASPRGWIAAQREGILLLERATSVQPGGDFPDGGCRIELYANSGLGYTEIETLSEERTLAPGQALENILVISLHRVAPDLGDAEFAARVRELLGETPPAAP